MPCFLLLWRKLWPSSMVFSWPWTLTLCLFQIETDSLRLVELIRRGEASSADVGSVIGEIMGSVEALPSWSISHVYRKDNLAAHTLSKLALSLESDYCRSDDFPPCSENCVLFDASF
ncbi:hypothetical protein QYF36_020169 [Acer negundo]|nr:hypothetical protein QYF36_020169 [Acer negundo]